VLTVSVAICDPNLNMWKNFLESLKKFAPEMKQLIIIDNASEDRSGWVWIAKDIFKDSEVEICTVLNDINVGFGRAHNEALKLATQPYFAVVNDDVEFFENWTTDMLKILKEDHTIGQVGMGEGVFNTLDMGMNATYTDTDSPEYVEGSCFIVPTDIARFFGLFDPVYEMGYCEDTDLSFRLREAGFLTKSIKKQWLHYRAFTSKKLKEKYDLGGYQTKNRLLFRSRWIGYLLTKKFGMRTVIFCRTMSIGDVFLLMPVIKAWKEKNPNDAIVVMTLTPHAIEGREDIDGIVKVGTPLPCDVFMNFDYSYEKDFMKHIVDSYARIAGVEVKSKIAELMIPEQTYQDVDKFLQHVEGPFVVFELSDSWGGKQWPEYNYAELAERLQKDGFKIIGVGKTNFPRVVNCDINLVNCLDVFETSAVMSRAKFLVSNEGLLVHLAQSMFLPAVVMYGTTRPEYCNEPSDLLEYVVSPAACQGCRHTHQAGTSIYCERQFACMEMITVDMVYDACKRLIRRKVTI